MHNAINNPPASVFFTCVEGVRRHGINFEDLNAHERTIWLEFTGFVAASIAARITSVLPAPDKCRRASDAIALQVRAEALQVLQEAAHVAERSPSSASTN
jgi:hypothetical protein